MNKFSEYTKFINAMTALHLWLDDITRIEKFPAKLKISCVLKKNKPAMFLFEPKEVDEGRSELTIFRSSQDKMADFQRLSQLRAFWATCPQHISIRLCMHRIKSTLWEMYCVYTLCFRTTPMLLTPLFALQQSYIVRGPIGCRESYRQNKLLCSQRSISSTPMDKTLRVTT